LPSKKELWTYCNYYNHIIISIQVEDRVAEGGKGLKGALYFSWVQIENIPK